jgi:hypothetical protein
MKLSYFQLQQNYNKQEKTKMNEKEEKVFENKAPCESEIKRNIMNVEMDLPLTQPLAKLNLSCKFRKAYEKFHEDDRIVEVRAKRRAYYHRPEVKAQRKAYLKAYYQISKIKARIKAYNQRPEVKARREAYRKEYGKRPEVIKMRRAYQRARYKMEKDEQ